MKSVGDALNRRELLRASVAVGAGAWLPLDDDFNAIDANHLTDRDGKHKSQRDGYGTALLRGDRRYRGPGHVAVLRDHARDYLVYHAYDAQQDGRAVLRIAPIDWTPDGWPRVTA